jgi:hypothetical protein
MNLRDLIRDAHRALGSEPTYEGGGPIDHFDFKLVAELYEKDCGCGPLLMEQDPVLVQAAIDAGRSDVVDELRVYVTCNLRGLAALRFIQLMAERADA